MQMIIQARGFSLTQALHDHVERRLNFTLARSTDRIRRVDVRLSDINGSRGGIDKRCLIEIRLEGLPNIIVEDIQSDMYIAIDRAAGRAGRTVTRQLSMDGGRRRSNVSLRSRQQTVELSQTGTPPTNT